MVAQGNKNCSCRPRRVSSEFSQSKSERLEAVNNLVHKAHEFNHLGILVRPTHIENLRVGVGNAFWGNARESTIGLEGEVKLKLLLGKKLIQHGPDIIYNHARKTFVHPSFCTDGPSLHNLQRIRGTGRNNFWTTGSMPDRHRLEQC